MEWFDNHCHLADLGDDAVELAREAGVIAMVDVGCDLASSTDCADRAAGLPQVWATAGVHPHEAKHGVDGIEELLARPEVVAVGECGLDYWYDHSPRDQQREVFALQIAMAHRHELPMVIHTRDAWDETFEILDREGVPDRTVFHCFTGGPDEAAKALERGALLSFSGIVTFRSAKELQAAAVACPLDSMMVETDSPYLAPVPHRGKPNRPANVVHVGECIAELQGRPVEEIAQHTTANAAQFYGVNLPD